MNGTVRVYGVHGVVTGNEIVPLNGDIPKQERVTELSNAAMRFSGEL